MKKILFILCFIGYMSFGYSQVDRTQQPASSPAPSIEIGNPQKIVFDNGLTLLVVENHKLPQVNINLRMDRDLVAENEKVGTSDLLSRMMGKGSKSIPKDDFEAEIDFMGASLSFSKNGSYASTLKKYFPRVMELLYETTLHPNFLEEEFQKEKDKTIEGLRANEKSVTSAARRVENLLSYGKKHPFGEFITEEGVSKLTLNDIEEKYKELYHAGNTYMIVSGDVVFEEVVALVEQYFSRWEAKKRSYTELNDPINAQTTTLHFVEMPNAVQTEIALLNLASLSRQNPDYFPIMVANQVLGGGGEARLFLNLREDKGYTYGAYSSFRTEHKTKSIFRAGSSVRNEVADSATVEILKEVKRLTNEPITNEELELVKAKYAGSFILSLENPELIASFAFNVLTQDLDKDFYRDFLKNINAVQPEDVQRVAKKYLLYDQARIVVTGKGREILDALENISFEGKKLPIEYHDKYGNSIERPNYDVKAPEGINASYIIKQHLKGIGGTEQLKSINSLKTNYSGEIQGTTLAIESTVTNEKQMLVEMKMMGSTMQKQVINKTKGYMITQGQKMDLEGDMLSKMIEDAEIFPELNMDTETIEFLGEVDLDGVKAYEIKVSDNKTLFYDINSFYKLQSTETVSIQEQIQTTIIKFKDHKETEGIILPHTTVVSMGPQEINFTLEKATFNDPIDPQIFE